MADTPNFLPADVTWRWQEAAQGGVPRFGPEDEALVGALITDVLRADVSLEETYPNGLPTPKSILYDFTPGSQTYDHLGEDSVTFVGAGAGGLMAAAYMLRRGMDPDNMKIFDPRGTYGGQWNDTSTKVGGFNNSVDVVFFEHILRTSDRAGEHMQAFLEDIGSTALREVELIPSGVSNLQHDRVSGLWRVTAEEHMTETNYVVLATGRPHPRRLDSARIRSNVDDLDPSVLKVERYQRILGEEELEASANGRPIVLIGGPGNSTGTMLKQIHAYEATHLTALNYVVLSDYSPEALIFPKWPLREGDRSVFRDITKGHFVGYSGDLAEDEASYYRALHWGKLVPRVTSIMFDSSTRELIVENTDKNIESTNAYKDPMVFSLIGYDRDLRLFRCMGALGTGDDPSQEPRIRNIDGAIAIPDGRTYSHPNKRPDDLSNAFAVGAAASTRENEKATVLPGIIGHVPNLMLTIAVRSAVRQGRTDTSHVQ